MPNVPIHNLIAGINKVLPLLSQIAAVRTGYQVTRNKVGNLAILDHAGGYVGYVDLLNGEIQLEFQVKTT